MSSSTRKLDALIKKNLLEMKRNIFSSFCEIFFPIILIFLFYLLKNAFKEEFHEFEKEEGSVENFIKNHSTVNVNWASKSYNINETWNGMSILSFLQLCSNLNEKNEERSKIAAINLPQAIKDKLIEDSLIYVHRTDGIVLNNSNFIDFDSLEDMNNYIEKSSYGDKDNPLVCFGINFEKNNNKDEYNYTLYYFENDRYDGAADVPSSQYVLDQFQSEPIWNHLKNIKKMDILIL